MDKINLESLVTESVNVNTVNIDKASTFEILTMINEEDKKVANAVEKQIPKIGKAVDEITKALKNGGRLIYIGAGTSGRLGILDASECLPTYGVPEDMIQGIIAGGKEAMFRAKEGIEDSQEYCETDLRLINFSNKDVLVGLAASGRTPYVIGGFQYAKKMGAITIGITCNPNSEMSKVADISIEAVTGAEVITGSTRMKAGTAQKMILNMISTATMIKMGKVYKNLMVDLKASNLKLVERAKRIVMLATNVSRDVAEKYLEDTDYDVKLAIFMIESGLDKILAKEVLNKNEGYIFKALENV
ncbi:N-acetylmuramic acid 6-phosphate etherase [Clostridium cavendishii DSM 21758]|uniref:N-acetylmuramic acid 6-phosphate etherase n=1 Tax=Clostridium cavendishii DSM 21758 TaxID=1121302 RepID=A0A1M6UNW8_9CLOT|nr:N-acetylmuramic acid 6-phosphate etherase [Clostridium cavendishii]SHK70871.1 N-acetylmuramic acid 6-phosphate etherase [Clostridium cavendishii DSM 21758]